MERQDNQQSRIPSQIDHINQNNNDKQQPTEVKVSARYNYFSLYRYSNTLDVFLIVFGVVGSAIYGLTLPAFTLLLGDLVNTLGSPTAELTDVNKIAISLVILGVISWIGGYLEFAFWMLLASRQTAIIRLKYLEAVLNQDIPFFDRDSTSGQLLRGLTDDILVVQAAMGEKVGISIQGLTTFLGGITIAFVQGWQLTLVILAMIPFITLSAFIFFKLIGVAQSQLSKSYADADQLAQQAISNVRTVASFNGEQKTLSKYENMLQLPMKLGIRINVWNGFAIGILYLLIFAAFGIALWYGNELVIDNNYQGGDVLNVILAAILGTQVLGSISPNFQYLVKGVASGKKIFSIIQRTPRIRSPPNAVTHEQVLGEIQLRNIKFVYPARPDSIIFKNLSLIIPSGKTVALVGQSGSGKSTVVQLIERFYDPLEGSILLDGTDIQLLNLQWYRDQIGLVSQEPTLFATTIRQNILYGNPNSTEDDIIQAAKAANAYQFIAQLPKKFDTQVGERGVQLSGGQKQRIAIARAILKNPKIMLLDEATSALDTQSERLVQEALDNMIVGRTTVVIAHRLSTIRYADIIAVVQEGEIVEQGSHDELILKDGGAYQTLVKFQQQSFTEETASKLPTAEIDENNVTINTEEPSLRFSSQENKQPSDTIRNSNNNSTKSTQSGIEIQPISAKLQSLNEGYEEAQQKEAKLKKVGRTRLWQLNKKEWPLALIGGIASMGLGAAMPVFAVALTDMVGIYFLNDTTEQRDEAKKWTLIMVGIGAGWMMFSVVQQYCFGVMGQVLARRIRTILMTAILKQEIGWFDKDENSSGNIASRLSSDTLYVRGAVGDALGLLIQNIVTVLTGLLIAYVTYWKMALVVTAAFPLMAVATIIKFKFVLGLSGSADELQASANQVASESICAVRVVQAYNMQVKIVELYDNLMSIPRKTQAKQSHVTGVTVGLSFCIIFCTYALAFWFGGREVENGNINVEEMLRVFFSILLGAVGAAAAQLQFPDIGKASAAIERIFNVVDRTPLIKDSEEATVGKNVQGEIELRDVEFAYPQRLSVKVFKQFNLVVEAGQTVAVVGESGSGKSTIVGLIERFYIPQSGCIMLDGVDVQNLKLKSLRDQIGLVSQEPVLFSMSVEENIKYGCEHATSEQVHQAATTANAAEFIEKMTQQYNTQVGEQGIQLSGGQKQRVAIARAIIKNPKILLLDEATSALDAGSEKIVQDALDKIMQGRTTIVIAHRLSTIRNANKIVVVNKGIVAEQGTHDELISLSEGLYRKMIMAQNQRN